MGVNSLPKSATRQRRGCDLNPGPSAPESSTLTTRLPTCSSSRSISPDRYAAAGMNRNTVAAGRIDGRTTDRCIDPAPYTMPAVSIRKESAWWSSYDITNSQHLQVLVDCSKGKGVYIG